MSTEEFGRRAADLCIDVLTAPDGKLMPILIDALRREYTEGAQCLAQCLTEANRKLGLLRNLAKVVSDAHIDDELTRVALAKALAACREGGAL